MKGRFANRPYVFRGLYREAFNLRKTGHNRFDFHFICDIVSIRRLQGCRFGRCKGLGSAWPGMFQQGSETGPSAGKDYHTVDYGLFEPFVLKQIIEK